MSDSFQIQAEYDKISAQILDIERELAEKRKLLRYIERIGEPGGGPPSDGRRRRRGRKPGGQTLESAILELLGQRGKMTTPELRDELESRGFKKSSVYSQISGMSKSGQLKAHKHKGRGFAYSIA